MNKKKKKAEETDDKQPQDVIQIKQSRKANKLKNQRKSPSVRKVEVGILSEGCDTKGELKNKSWRQDKLE